MHTSLSLYKKSSYLIFKTIFFLTVLLISFFAQSNQAMASQPNPTILSSELMTSTEFTAGSPSIVELSFNSQGTQIVGVQLVAYLSVDSDTPSLKIPNLAGYDFIYQKITKLNDGYQISLAAVKNNMGKFIESTEPTPFAQIVIPQRKAGMIKIGFIDEQTIAPLADSSNPKSGPLQLNSATYTTTLPLPTPIASSTPLPISTPSPKPSHSPTTSPSPHPSPKPSLSPTPSPSIPKEDNPPKHSTKMKKMWKSWSAFAANALSRLRKFHFFRLNN